MGIAKGFAAAAAVMGMLASVPASAGSLEEAEKLRRLDIMLMVTGLRCRNTADNFQADYGRFTTKHIATLNAASRQLQSQLATRVGPAQAEGRAVRAEAAEQWLASNGSARFAWAR